MYLTIGKECDRNIASIRVLEVINFIRGKADLSPIVEDGDQETASDSVAIYGILSQTIFDCISLRNDNEISPREYDQILGKASDANSLLLEGFGPEAFEGFAKIEPTLDQLLQQDRINDVIVALKLYSELIKRSATFTPRLEVCYSLRYKNKIISAISIFLQDKRIEVLMATLKLVVTLAKYVGVHFHQELYTFLPPLNVFLNHYNNRLLNSENYKFVENSTRPHAMSGVETVGDAACCAVKSILLRFQDTISSSEAAELIICKIILSIEDFNSWKFFKSNIKPFLKSFGHPSKVDNVISNKAEECNEITAIREMIYMYIRRGLELHSCTTEAIWQYSHLLKKTSILFRKFSNTPFCNVEQDSKGFYNLMENVIKKCAEFFEEKQGARDQKYLNIALNYFYTMHKSTFEVKVSRVYLENMLHACDDLLCNGRNKHDIFRLLLSLYLDLIRCSSIDRPIWVSKFKDKLMPIVISVLKNRTSVQVTLTALKLLGELSQYGDQRHIDYYHRGVELIIALVKEQKLCYNKKKLQCHLVEVREAAAATMAIILNLELFEEGRVKHLALKHWLTCFPVVFHEESVITANTYLIKLIKDDNRAIFGRYRENLGYIVKALCQVIISGNSISQEFLTKVKISLITLSRGSDKKLVKNMLKQQFPKVKSILKTFKKNKKKKK